MGRQPRPQRALRGVAAGLAAVVLAVPAISLRLDKSHVFEQVRGRYRDARLLETLETSAGPGGATLRLVAPRNHRGETPAAVWIRRPLALADEHRIVVAYAGAKTGRKIFDLIPHRDDLVLVAPRYPYRSPEGLLEHLRLPYDLRRAAYRTVAGGMLATSFLADSEGLDLDRLVVLGSSIGSAFATLHGALDPRVPRVVLIHGGGDFPAIIRFFERRRGNPLSGEAKAWLAALLVDTFDPVHYVDRIAPRELIMISARDDGAFPIASTMALFRRAGEPKRLIWTDSGHVRAKNEPLIGDLMALVDTALDD